MDVLLKRFFWVVNLAVIGTCAALGGRAASHYVEQSVLAQETVVPRRVSPPPVEKTRSKDADEIIKRDIFCSFCSPIDPTEKPAEEVDTGPVTPQKTSLNLELISTMVVPQSEKWSLAVIKDNNSKDKDAALYGVGAKLPGDDVTVVAIHEKKVYVKNGERYEYLDIDGAGAPPQAAVSQPPMIASSGEPIDDQIGNHVRCSGSSCEIDRSLVDQLLANTTSLATAARFVPSIKDGRPNGFKLYAIRPSSIFGRIGLQNGDTIKSINNMEMSSPDQALTVYTKVRTASHLNVSVERRGETVTLDYTIR